ncbi:MAG: SBBP repeat-containing protein [Acidobacteriota bacterium]
MPNWIQAIWKLRATAALVLLGVALLLANPSDDPHEDDILCLTEQGTSTRAVCMGLILGLGEGLSPKNAPNTDFSSPAPALVFEPNLGQAEAQFDFVARGRNMGILLSHGSAVIALPAGKRAPPRFLKASFGGARSNLQAVVEDPLPGRANYFFGSDPEKWITDVPSSAKVRYNDVYPGIDVVYYGNERQLEHDFIVHPGADPRRIQIAFEGADGVRIGGDGDAHVRVNGVDVLWKKPLVYQQVAKQRRPVESRYRLSSGVLSFEVGQFDPDRPLVIDPVVAYSTYLGRSQNDGASRIAVDAQGNSYTTGITFEFNFPTSFRAGTFQRGYGTVFVNKVSASGDAAAYTAYIGGNFVDGAVGIAVDDAGNAYLAGGTNSTDFPVTPGVIKSRFSPPGTSPDPLDCFVTKLNPAGNGLVYSTLLGGGNEDGCSSIAVDRQNNAYVAGYTASSSDFPTSASAPQRNLGGQVDAFVAKLNSGATALTYSTLLGGQNVDIAMAVAIDSQGAAYLTGNTRSANDFPVTPGAYQMRYGGAASNLFLLGDAFVAKLNPAGTAFSYVTYLGGSSDEIGFGIAVDAQGAAYVIGDTFSANFPATSGAFRTTYGGATTAVRFAGGDAFVAKLNPTGSGLTYATFIGGSDQDWGSAIAVDGSGNAWIGGATLSTNFPTTQDAAQRTFGGSDPAAYIAFGDAWVAQLNNAGSALIYATYLGGSGDEFIAGLALDPSGGVYVSGSTLSNNFPTSSSAMQKSYGGFATRLVPIGDAFIVKYSGTGTGTFVSAIVSAASYAGGGVAPGEIVVLTGGGIGPQQLTTLELTPQGTVSTLLNGTRVLFDNVAAPVIYASSGQTSVIVPYEVANKQSTQMVVEYSGGRSAALTVPVLQSKPALFSANASGRGQGAILNADNSYNSASSPIAKGGIVQLFGTGEGPIDPPGVTGRLSTSVVPRILLPTQVTIGGQNARVLYAGAAPGAVGGLFQINAEVPAGAASGAQEVIVTIANTRSQTGLTVAVQ